MPKKKRNNSSSSSSSSSSKGSSSSSYNKQPKVKAVTEKAFAGKLGSLIGSPKKTKAKLPPQNTRNASKTVNKKHEEPKKQLDLSSQPLIEYLDSKA